MGSSRSKRMMMQPPPEENPVGAWKRFSIWLGHLRPLTRLLGVTIALAVFLTVLPHSLLVLFWDSLNSHKSLAGLLVGFSLLAISLLWSAGQRLDRWVFLTFNLRWPRPAWLDRIMTGFTQVGSGVAAFAIALVLFLTGNRLLAYALILGTLTLWMLVEMVKFLVQRSRPFVLMTQTRVVGYQPRGRSFPSGHTSQAFFMATLLAQRFHPSIWIVFLLYAAALLVGITRMYIGVHYPRDVLAGAILGIVWGFLGAMMDGYA